MDLHFRKTLSLNPAIIDSLFQLWNAEYPEIIAHQNTSELKEYLLTFKNAVHRLAFNSDAELVAWCCGFEREELPWFAMIIDRQYQGLGLGSKFLSELKKDYAILNGWAIDQDSYLRADGSIYPSPLAFYQKNNFRISQRRGPKESPISIVHILWP